MLSSVQFPPYISARRSTRGSSHGPPPVRGASKPVAQAPPRSTVVKSCVCGGDRAGEGRGVTARRVVAWWVGQIR